VARIINSTEVQSVLKAKLEPPKKFSAKKNPFKNKKLMAILNPGSIQKKLSLKRAHEEGTKEYEKVQEAKKARVKSSKKHNSKAKKGQHTFYKTLMKAFETKPEDDGEDEAEGEDDEEAERIAAEEKAAEAEEERKKAEEEAKAKAAEALKTRELPKLSKTRDLNLKEIHSRGLVEMVQHKPKKEKAIHPEPNPGTRFVVTDHPVEVGKHGTVQEPADKGQWKCLLDDGSCPVLSADAFTTAPPPVASVTLKKKIDFVGVHHGQDVTPKYTKQKDAEEILKNTAEILKIFDTVIVSIEGHTATPDEKMDEWAHSLAQARADKIKSVLVEMGIEADRLKPIGLPGKYGTRQHDLVLHVVSL